MFSVPVGAMCRFEVQVCEGVTLATIKSSRWIVGGRQFSAAAQNRDKGTTTLRNEDPAVIEGGFGGIGVDTIDTAWLSTGTQKIVITGTAKFQHKDEMNFGIKAEVKVIAPKIYLSTGQQPGILDDIGFNPVATKNYDKLEFHFNSREVVMNVDPNLVGGRGGFLQVLKGFRRRGTEVGNATQQMGSGDNFIDLSKELPNPSLFYESSNLVNGDNVLRTEDWPSQALERGTEKQLPFVEKVKPRSAHNPVRSYNWYQIDRESFSTYIAFKAPEGTMDGVRRSYIVVLGRVDWYWNCEVAYDFIEGDWSSPNPSVCFCGKWYLPEVEEPVQDEPDQQVDGVAQAGLAMYNNEAQWEFLTEDGRERIQQLLQRQKLEMGQVLHEHWTDEAWSLPIWKGNSVGLEWRPA